MPSQITGYSSSGPSIAGKNYGAVQQYTDSGTGTRIQDYNSTGEEYDVEAENDSNYDQVEQIEDLIESLYSSQNSGKSIQTFLSDENVQQLLNEYGIDYSQYMDATADSYVSYGQLVAQLITIRNDIYVEPTFTFSAQLTNDKFAALEDYVTANGLLIDYLDFSDIVNTEPFQALLATLEIDPSYFTSSDQFWAYYNRQRWLIVGRAECEANIEHTEEQRQILDDVILELFGTTFEDVLSGQVRGTSEERIQAWTDSFHFLITEAIYPLGDGNGSKISEEHAEWMAQVIYAALQELDNSPSYTVEEIKDILINGNKLYYYDYDPSAEYEALIEIEELLKDVDLHDYIAQYNPEVTINADWANGVLAENDVSAILSDRLGYEIHIESVDDIAEIYTWLDSLLASQNQQLVDNDKAAIDLMYASIVASDDYKNYDYFRYDDLDHEIEIPNPLEYGITMDYDYYWTADSGLSPIDLMYYVKEHNPDLSMDEIIANFYIDTGTLFNAGVARAAGRNDVQDTLFFVNLIKANEYIPGLIETYNYLYYNYGIETANQYLIDTENEVNSVIAEAQVGEFFERLNSNAENIEDISLEIEDPATGAIVKFVYVNGALAIEGFGGGIEQYFAGLVGWFNTDRNKTVYEWTQYYMATALMSHDDKVMNGLITEDGASASQFIDYSVDYSRFSNGVYNISTSIGNMLPSIMLSSINPFLGSLSIAASSGGSSFRDALTSGYDMDKVIVYALASGISEAALEYLLGSLPGVSKASQGKIPTLAGWLMAAYDEGKEEFIQEGFDIILRSALFGEEITLEEALEQMSISALYGAITGGLLNIAPYVGAHHTATDMVSMFLASNVDQSGNPIKTSAEIAELCNNYLTSSDIQITPSFVEDVAAYRNGSNVLSTEGSLQIQTIMDQWNVSEENARFAYFNSLDGPAISSLVEVATQNDTSVENVYLLYQNGIDLSNASSILTASRTEGKTVEIACAEYLVSQAMTNNGLSNVDTHDLTVAQLASVLDCDFDTAKFIYDNNLPANIVIDSMEKYYSDTSVTRAKSQIDALLTYVNYDLDKSQSSNMELMYQVYESIFAVEQNITIRDETYTNFWDYLYKHGLPENIKTVKEFTEFLLDNACTKNLSQDGGTPAAIFLGRTANGKELQFANYSAQTANSTIAENFGTIFYSTEWVSTSEDCAFTFDYSDIKKFFGNNARNAVFDLTNLQFVQRAIDAGYTIYLTHDINNPKTTDYYYMELMTIASYLGCDITEISTTLKFAGNDGNIYSVNPKNSMQIIDSNGNIYDIKLVKKSYVVTEKDGTQTVHYGDYYSFINSEGEEIKCNPVLEVLSSSIIAATGCNIEAAQCIYENNLDINRISALTSMGYSINDAVVCTLLEVNDFSQIMIQDIFSTIEVSSFNMADIINAFLDAKVSEGVLADIFTESTNAAIDKYYDFFYTYRDHVGAHTYLVAQYAADLALKLDGVNIDEVIYASLCHDLGMRGGYYFNENTGRYELVDSIAVNPLDWKRSYSYKSETARKNHPLNSALTILTTDGILPSGVDIDVVALLAMSHSKSTSGIKDFSNPKQWLACVDKLNSALQQYNADNGTSFTLDVEKLQQMIADPAEFQRLQDEALCIRDGDAMSAVAVDAKGNTIMQTGSYSEVSSSSPRGDNYNLRIGTIAEETATIVDVIHNPDETTISLTGDDTGYSRRIHAGELNTNYSSQYDGKNYVATVTLADPNAFPHSSWQSITERVGEVVTYGNCETREFYIQLPAEARGTELGNFYENAILTASLDVENNASVQAFYRDHVHISWV